jgi:hypothetical protein
MPCSDNLVCGRASSGSAGTSSRERIEGWDHAIDCVGVVGAEGGEHYPDLGLRTG